MTTERNDTKTSTRTSALAAGHLKNIQVAALAALLGCGFATLAAERKGVVSEKLASHAQWARIAVAEDLRRWRPEIVLVDHCEDLSFEPYAIVVRRDDPRQLVGYLGRSGIMQARLRRHADEYVREPGWIQRLAVFPWPR